MKSTNKTVKVTYTTEYAEGKDSFMITKPKLTKARAVIQEVEHHYIGGKVRTKSGDTWAVVPNPNPKESTYIAVRG